MDSLIPVFVMTLILKVKPVLISGVFGVNPDLIAGIVTNTEDNGDLIRTGGLSFEFR